jgi:hypothetical protein
MVMCLLGNTGQYSVGKYSVIKSLCAPDDYSTKTRNNILVSVTYHDNVVSCQAVILSQVVRQESSSAQRFFDYPVQQVNVDYDMI